MNMGTVKQQANGVYVSREESRVKKQIHNLFHLANTHPKLLGPLLTILPHCLYHGIACKSSLLTLSHEARHQHPHVDLHHQEKWIESVRQITHWKMPTCKCLATHSMKHMTTVSAEQVIHWNTSSLLVLGKLHIDTHHQCLSGRAYNETIHHLAFTKSYAHTLNHSFC